MIHLECSPKREIQRADANGLQRIGKWRVPSSAEAFAPENKRDAGQQTQCNSAGWTNPAAVEGVLDEIGDTYQDGNNPDSVQP